MRRDEIIASVIKLAEAINQSELRSAFRGKLGRESEKHAYAEVFVAYSDFREVYRDLSENDAKVITVFDLDILMVPEKIAALLSPIPEGPSKIRSLYYGINRFMEAAPKIVELLDRGFDKDRFATEDTHTKSILRLIVFESNEGISSLDRYLTLFSAVRDLYHVAAVLTEVPTDGLSVVGFDSGSDKSIDFEGKAKAIVEIKKLLRGVWEWLTFHKELKTKQQIKAVAESLPVFEKILELEKKKAIGREQAGKLRKVLISGIDGLLEAGAATPDMDSANSMSPSVLLAPSPKLLNPPQSGSRRDSSTHKTKNVASSKDGNFPESDEKFGPGFDDE